LIFSIVEFESAKLQNNYEIRGMNKEKSEKKGCLKSFLCGGRLQHIPSYRWLSYIVYYKIEGVRKVLFMWAFAKRPYIVCSK